MEHWGRLEKLLGELYRKEIDNEENIWRSPPFFSATLAVEVAVVTQVSPLIVTLSGYSAWFAAGAAVLAMLLVAAVLFLLNRSARPADFRHIASEPDLVEYISAFEAYAKRSGQAATGGALRTEPQRLLVKQYARATPNNRTINQRRARARTN